MNAGCFHFIGWAAVHLICLVIPRRSMFTLEEYCTLSVMRFILSGHRQDLLVSECAYHSLLSLMKLFQGFYDTFFFQKLLFGLLFQGTLFCIQINTKECSSNSGQVMSRSMCLI